MASVIYLTLSSDINTINFWYKCVPSRFVRFLTCLIAKKNHVCLSQRFFFFKLPLYSLPQVSELCYVLNRSSFMRDLHLFLCVCQLNVPFFIIYTSEWDKRCRDICAVLHSILSEVSKLRHLYPLLYCRKAFLLILFLQPTWLKELVAL